MKYYKGIEDYQCFSNGRKNSAKAKILSWRIKGWQDTFVLIVTKSLKASKSRNTAPVAVQMSVNCSC